MIKFADNIKIAGRTYKILFPYYFRERVDFSGQYDGATLEIRVGNTDECGNIKPDILVLNTFLHELTHAIDYLYCMGKMGMEVEKESIVESFATGLAQVFSENKNIWTITDEG